MKNLKRYMMLPAALLCLAASAQARHNDLLHENVVIQKGDTSRQDVATDKSITVNGVLDGDAVSVGGASVTVNNEVTGDLVAIGGAVHVTGLVKGDAVSIGGPVEITGKVAGDVVSLGGSVALSGVGEVDGDIVAMGGTVVKGDKTVHKGQVVNFDLRILRTVLPRVIKLAAGSQGRQSGNYNYGGGNSYDQASWWKGGLIGMGLGIGLVIMFSMLFTGIVVLMLPAIFFPKHVENAAAVISGDMWRTCGIGALIVMGFFPGLLIMVVSILGIPLVPFALILFAAAGVLGMSAFSVVLQGRFFEGIKRPGPAGLPGKVAAGFGIMAGLLFFGRMIPFIGGVLSLIGFILMAFGTMIGLGAAWMSRLGNKVHVSPSQPPAPQQGSPAAQ